MQLAESESGQCLTIIMILVICTQADLSSGLLAVAHDHGDLRVYQFCTSSRELTAAVLGVAPGHRRRVSDEDPASQQPPGFQHVLRCQTPSTDAVTALALSSRAGLLGCISSSGDLCMMDLTQVGDFWLAVKPLCVLIDCAWISMPAM